MKLFLHNSFFRLAVWILLAVLLLTISGYLVTRAGDLLACSSWPLCLPHGTAGWIGLLHRLVSAVVFVLMGLLLHRAWRTQRDHRLLLPWATLTVVFFLAQVFVGAILVTRGYPGHLVFLHSLTTLAVWIALLGLVVFSALYAQDTIAFPPLELRQRLRDFLTLTKPVVVALLLVTTYAGLVIGGRSLPSFSLAIGTLLGGFMAAGGSSALNQYIDRDLDRNMQRTARRPMAAGRMTPAEGLAFGLALSAASFYVLAGFVNLLAALLSLAGIIYYVVIYSLLLKKATVQNIVIGGGAGAIPPMVGWAAATGSLSIPAFFLFAIVFIWTPPHFWALAIVRRNDYARAGVPMLPVVRGEKVTRWQIFIYTLELVLLTMLMPLLGYSGSIFLISAVVLGIGLIYAAWRVWKMDGNKVAWQMYRWSSMYLFFIFAALVADVLL